jgi:hypothetical protein
MAPEPPVLRLASHVSGISSLPTIVGQRSTGMLLLYRKLVILVPANRPEDERRRLAIVVCLLA